MLANLGCLILLVASPVAAFSPRSLAGRRLAVRQQANPLEDFFASASSALQGFANKLDSPAAATRFKRSEYDDEIEAANELLLRAAATKSEDGGEVVDCLLGLEKALRGKAKTDPSVAVNTLAALDGAWRLVFTTGTLDTQKKIKGRINYFPLKAVQCFSTDTMRLTNSIMVGDFPLIKFYGPFSFNLAARKVEFDFTSIAVLGLPKFDLPTGGAAEIGAATGLGSDNNKKLVEKGKKPFFNWISADEQIATARGGGGGLALWKRDLDMEARNAADPAAF